MSVYKRKGEDTYSYDFRVSRHRYSGGTGETSKREAVRIEAIERQRVKAEAKEHASFDGRNMTVAMGTSLYWDQVGQYHKNSMSTLATIDWLRRFLGDHTLLRDINNARVAALVAKRRSQLRRVGKKENRVRKVGPATVNRTVTEPLRKVMLRARKLWGVPIQEIDWGEHMLPEPRERVREATPSEEAGIMAELDRGYDTAVAFALLSGCRRMEVVGLIWSRVDFFGRQFTVIGKGGHERTIPMNSELFDLLWALRGRHETAVFAYTAARTDKHKKIGRGLNYPMTDAGLRTAMRRAVVAAGVENFHFHDTRHTAATRVLRESNLRVVQNLLGHRDVATTAKYAHAQADDIRAALEATSATKATGGQFGRLQKRK